MSTLCLSYEYFLIKILNIAFTLDFNLIHCNLIPSLSYQIVYRHSKNSFIVLTILYSSHIHIFVRQKYYIVLDDDIDLKKNSYSFRIP